MSYNGYNQYSPYWQPTSGQNTPQNTGQSFGRPGTAYQPLSAYQNNQQIAKASVSQSGESSSAASYSNQGYGNIAVNGAGNGRPQDSRADYTNISDRASLDGATALGNLAYASSLGRDGPIPQAANYNRQKSNANYGTAASYGVNSASSIQYRTVDERRGSGGSSREDNRSQQATASPSFDYSANNAGYQVPSAGSNTHVQPQYSQPPRSSTEQYRNQYSHPSRPSSGQATQQSHSKLGSHAVPSPNVSKQNTPNQAQVSKNGGSILGKEPTRIHTPQSDKQPLSSQVSKGATQSPQVSQATVNPPTENTTSRKAGVIAAKDLAAKRVNEVHQSPAVDSRRDQASKPTTPMEPQYTTVDPSQVFNHIEYSRRQAAAAAEAAAVKKAAEEPEAARFAATQPKLATPQANGTEPDSAKKDQMELEMKQMIEKMRDYKAQDPSLFTQIWEQVKKSQPPQCAPSRSLQGSATSPIVTNGQLPSPSLIPNQLPSESELPAGDEFPPDFDRGRFPAQRRRRGGSTKVSTKRKSGNPSGSTGPAAENQGSPIPPEIAIPAPKVGQIFPDPGSQSMQQAMKQFHQNSKSPVAKSQQLPESEKQAATHNSTDSPKVTSTRPPSESAPAKSAPPSKPGGTYWPESKKRALAEAAQIALTSTRPNQTKTITTQEIHELLDQNPSYTQMCEILEYRGFVIDRGEFARVLLKAVPDLGSASNSPDAASTTTADATRPNQPNATPTVTAPANHTTATAKATSATPTAGSLGKFVKASSNGSAAQTKTPQPLPYSVPPTAVFRTPNEYVTPYAHVPAPPVAEQISKGNESNGLPRGYRFVEPVYRTPDKPRQHVKATNQGRSNEPAFHPSFSLYHQPESINGQVLDQNEAHPNDVIPYHPSKQEMARKRTFGEIVDLTQTLSEDEEVERHRAKPRNDYESASAPGKSVKDIFNQVTQRQQNSGRNTPKPFKYKYSGRDALLQSNDIVEPMNKRRDALRRSSYNSKTIARDVLLCLGKHPSMTPLNAHLDVLKDRFKAVDYESNLSTFRWDLVDPEGETNAESSDTEDEVAVPAVAAVTHQRTAPVAVMIDGHGGHQRPVPMAVMTDGHGADVAKDNQAPSHTVNSAGKPSKRGPYKKTRIRLGLQPISSATANTPKLQSSQGSPHVPELSKESSTNPADFSRFAYINPDARQTDLTSLGTPESAVKRKGRPPGVKNKQVRPDKGIPKKNKTPAQENPSTAKAKPSDEETKRQKSSAAKISPVRNFSVEQSSTPIPTRPHATTKTPSKPTGLGKSISATTPRQGIAVVIPSRSPSVAIITPQASAKKGKPEKTDDVANSMHYSAPPHTMYRCYWENCPAELHSLETLKKHVRKHRRAVDGVYRCLWAECSDSSNPTSNNNTQSEDGQQRRLKFKTDTEWVEHVESNHLRTKWDVLEGANVNPFDVQ